MANFVGRGPLLLLLIPIVGAGAWDAIGRLSVLPARHHRKAFALGRAEIRSRLVGARARVFAEVNEAAGAGSEFVLGPGAARPAVCVGAGAGGLVLLIEAKTLRVRESGVGGFSPHAGDSQDGRLGFVGSWTRGDGCLT